MADVVIDTDGAESIIELWDSKTLQVRLADGTLISLPRETVTEAGNGRYQVAFSLARFAQKGDIAIPVVAETIAVDKRTLERQVRIQKTVQSQDIVVEEPLQREDIEIEHLPINRYVDEALPVRTEGDTTIIPLVEEVLVVEKKLLLREEIRITRRKTTDTYTQVYTLRREDVQVEREDDVSR